MVMESNMIFHHHYLSEDLDFIRRICLKNYLLDEFYMIELLLGCLKVVVSLISTHISWKIRISKNRQNLMIQVSLERKWCAELKFTWIINFWVSIKEKSIVQFCRSCTSDFSSLDGRKSTEMARIDSEWKVVSEDVNSVLMQVVRNLSASCPLLLSSRTKSCGSIFSIMASSNSMSHMSFDRIFSRATKCIYSRRNPTILHLKKSRPITQFGLPNPNPNPDLLRILWTVVRGNSNLLAIAVFVIPSLNHWWIRFWSS